MSYIGKGVETVTFNTATTLDVAGNITLGGTVDGRDVATDGTKLDTITSGAIADILQDTTPQLGGNLDLNTSDVIGTGNINVTGSITGTSFVSTGNMSFTNNSKAIFGTSPSLEIYHDGSNSILDDVGAGNFKMQLAGADKLEITSTGVDVTGTVTADGLTVQNVTVGVDGTYGGNYRTLGFSGNTNGSTRIFGTTDNSDNLYLAAGTGRGINFWVNGSSSTVMQVNSSGNVGINTTSPDYGKFTVQNTAGTGKVLLDSYQAVPTTENVMAIYADASNGYIESYNNGYKNIIIAGSGGNVGIGQSNPTSPNGATDFLHIGNSSNQDTSIVLQDAVEIWEIYNNDDLLFNFDTTNVMTLQRVTGNVGIGTQTPSFRLAVEDGSSATRVNVRNTANAAAGSGIYFQVLNGASTVGQGTIATQSNGDMAIFTGTSSGAERMRLDSSGNLGIGTTSPASYGRLAVMTPTATFGYFGIGNSVGGGGGVNIGSFYGTTKISYIDTVLENGTPSSEQSRLQFATIAGGTLTERMRITGDGNVGIGTASPAYTLQVGEGNGQMSLGNATSGNGSSRLKFLSSNSQKNWQISTNDNIGGALEFTQTTTAGGTTFAASPTFRINSNGSLTATASLTYPSGNGPAWGATYITGNSSSHVIDFFAAAVNQLRITSTGLRVGTTTNGFASSNEKLTILGGSSSVYDACMTMRSGYATGGTSVNGVYFMNSANGTAGYISWNGSSTSYNTSSDYRLKENVTADWDATTRLKQLNPVRFNFIADADTTVDGFLAHEVQDIVPEAISGTKDGMMDEEYTVSAATGDIYTPAAEATYDDDGVGLTSAVDEVIHSTDVERPEELEEGQLWRETTAAVMGTRSVPEYQGIDQAKLVPLLVKTIQELEARIAALENT